MRRTVLTLLMLLVILTCAQAGGTKMIHGSTHTESIFRRYHKNPDVTETLIQGETLKAYRLSVYQGITINDRPQAADEIEPLLVKDGLRAKEREVSYREGRLYYAFYQLPCAGENVYLFYLNNHLAGGNNITLIYLRGTASRDDIQKML